MRYKSPATILNQIARRGSAKVRLQAVELLSRRLPILGGYRRGSPENLLWQIASDSSITPSKRYRALCTLLITLAQKQKAKNDSITE
jgi:hypothetical protein